MRAEGLVFSANSKQSLMEGLAVEIQQGHIHFPEGVIVEELEQFEYELTRTGVKYSAPRGLHDDAVMALALAVRATGHKRKAAFDFDPEEVRERAIDAELVIETPRPHVDDDEAAGTLRGIAKLFGRRL